MNLKKDLKSSAPRPGSARPNERGIILIAATLILVALMAAAIAVVRRTESSTQSTRRDYHEEKVFQVADGGVNVADRWLRDQLLVNANPPQSLLDNATAPTLPGYTFSEYSITKQARRDSALITRGPYAGLRANVQPYLIRSHAIYDNANVQKTVQVTLNQYWINLYQYAIYYDGDLELFPANPSTFTGRIHANGNIYLGSNSNFDIVGSVTAAGHIFNTPKDPTLIYHGKARIADRAGHWHDLSYDWRDPNWVTRSLGDWDGLVEDSSHGITAQPAPILTLANPIDLIKRGVPGDDSLHQALRYYYRAGIKIIDGVATDSMGNPLTIPNGIISTQNVMDQREGHTMSMHTFNMAHMISSGFVPANHVIYISYSDLHAAVRIDSASALPAGGLVIATDNPCYVWGNYNTVNKQRSSFFCDAFTLFSNSWTDANATRPLNQRGASNTFLNSCIVAGDVPTTTGHYSGGAANLIRLMEKWTAANQLTYRGSLVCIYHSEQGIGQFVDGAPVFTENHRNSAWDPDLNDPSFWPDGSLADQNLVRSDWTSE